MDKYPHMVGGCSSPSKQSNNRSNTRVVSYPHLDWVDLLRLRLDRDAAGYSAK
jgi:hypothetical protein